MTRLCELAKNIGDQISDMDIRCGRNRAHGNEGQAIGMRVFNMARIIPSEHMLAISRRRQPRCETNSRWKRGEKQRSFRGFESCSQRLQETSQEDSRRMRTANADASPSCSKLVVSPRERKRRKINQPSKQAKLPKKSRRLGMQAGPYKGAKQGNV